MIEPVLSHVLPNGLVLLAEPMDWLESAAFTLLVPAGCAEDPAGEQSQPRDNHPQNDGLVAPAGGGRSGLALREREDPVVGRRLAGDRPGVRSRHNTATSSQ